ncbi:MAG TPA: MFS transporter [Xanthobacteraceae bacterium]|nr:MFS transporter [Xanthobacteraceae bacterium]
MSGRPNNLMRVAAAVIGNAFEWYDFTIYAYMTPIISSLFFPVDPDDPATQINAVLATTAVFGVGFFMRPVGGVVLGVIGDKYGRRAGMVLGMALMALATLILTLAPTYRQVGLAAPVILVVARLLQGFSLGGQFGTSTAFLIEMAPPGKSGIYGSWQMFGQIASLAVGTAFGVVLTQFFTAAQMDAGLWRIPFAFGVIILPVTWYIRRYLAESEAFVAMQKARAATPGEGIGMGLVEHMRHLLVSIGMIAASAVSFYAIYGYTVTYAKTVLHLPVEGAFVAEMVAACLMLAAVPVGGVLCDRFSHARKEMLVGFLALYFILMYPAYAWLVEEPTTTKLVIVQLAVSLVSALFLGVYCTTMSELFPVRIRSTGLSIANNVAVLIFGGFAQFFLTWIFKVTGSQIAPVYYVMFGIALGLVAALFMPPPADDAKLRPATA